MGATMVVVGSVPPAPQPRRLPAAGSTQSPAGMSVESSRKPSSLFSEALHRLAGDPAALDLHVTHAIDVAEQRPHDLGCRERAQAARRAQSGEPDPYHLGTAARDNLDPAAVRLQEVGNDVGARLDLACIR